MDLDALLEEILVDAYGDDEQMVAFHCAISELPWPCDAQLGGLPVTVHGVDWDGQPYSGLEASVSHEGHAFDVVFKSLMFPEGTLHALHVAAHRHWLGLDR